MTATTGAPSVERPSSLIHRNQVVILKKVQVDIAARGIGNKPRSELAINPFDHTDLGLNKYFPSGAERARYVEIRMEAWLMAVNANFGQPDGNDTDCPGFLGVVTSVTGSTKANLNADPPPGWAVQLVGKSFSEGLHWAGSNPHWLSLNPFLNPPFVESGWVAQVSFLRPGFFCRTDLYAETQSRKARYQTVESVSVLFIAARYAAQLLTTSQPHCPQAKGR
jgi:hypothetical protein